MSEVVNIPADRLDAMLAAPVKMAEIEAQSMVRAGNIVGATAHIAAAVQKSAAMKGQILAAQRPAPAPAPAPTQAASPPAVAPPPFATQTHANIWRQRQAQLDPAGDPRTDVSLPFGLGRRRR
jgi:hypothetical protein